MIYCFDIESVDEKGEIMEVLGNYGLIVNIGNFLDGWLYYGGFLFFFGGDLMWGVLLLYFFEFGVFYCSLIKVICFSFFGVIFYYG